MFKPKPKKSYLLPLLFFIFLMLSLALFFFINDIKSLFFKEDFTGNVINECQNHRDWRDCYGQKLAFYNKTQPISDTLLILEGIKNNDLKTRDCHLIAHYIASEETAKDPGNWLDLFQHVDQNSCVGGFIHGALEGKKRFDPDFKLNIATIPEICHTINRHSGDNNLDPCAHAIGHLLLVENYGSITEAVNICKSLPDSIKASCSNGVFMENITRENLIDHDLAKPISYDEESALTLEYLCRSHSRQEELSCWREISHIYAPLAKNNIKKVYQLCLKAPSDNTRDECYLHSFNSVLPGNDFSSEDLKQICMPYINTEKVNACIEKAVTVFTLSNSYDQTKEFCSQFNEDQKRYCITVFGQKLSNVVDIDNQSLICQNLKLEYRESCNCISCQRGSKIQQED